MSVPTTYRHDKTVDQKVYLPTYIVSVPEYFYEFNSLYCYTRVTYLAAAIGNFP